MPAPSSDQLLEMTDPPHSLGLVIDFVNSLDVETSTDELAERSSAEAWFRSRGMLGEASQLSPSERERAVELREALRALLVAHNGGSGDVAAGRVLERVAREGALGVAFTGSGAATLEPRGSGFAATLAALLVPVAEAGADGTWLRVKACRSPDCQWAFYDRSRNRSGVWCEMAVCGNRKKVRAYRERGRTRRP
jgi:predicted RNA-binding Zn ribbon-like protein